MVNLKQLEKQLKKQNKPEEPDNNGEQAKSDDETAPEADRKQTTNPSSLKAGKASQ